VGTGVGACNLFHAEMNEILYENVLEIFFVHHKTIKSEFK